MIKALLNKQLRKLMLGTSLEALAQLTVTAEQAA
jgi:hypothetical protein